VEEALEEVRAAIGVDDLGMELDAVDAPLGIPKAATGASGAEAVASMPAGRP